MHAGRLARRAITSLQQRMRLLPQVDEHAVFDVAVEHLRVDHARRSREPAGVGEGDQAVTPSWTFPSVFMVAQIEAASIRW